MPDSDTNVDIDVSEYDEAEAETVYRVSAIMPE
jgi:hypothetical protein